MNKSSPEKASKFWLEKSVEDLDTAKALLDAGQYNWCAFICQQSLEKVLKAGYVKKFKKIPPYIHKLERLTDILRLEPPEEILASIIEIDKYYLATRYPSYKAAVNITDKAEAKEIYHKTEEAYEWLKQVLEL